MPGHTALTCEAVLAGPTCRGFCTLLGVLVSSGVSICPNRSNLQSPHTQAREESPKPSVSNVSALTTNVLKDSRIVRDKGRGVWERTSGLKGTSKWVTEGLAEVELPRG